MILTFILYFVGLAAGLSVGAVAEIARRGLGMIKPDQGQSLGCKELSIFSSIS